MSGHQLPDWNTRVIFYRLSFQSNTRFLWCWFTMLCDWFRKLASLSRPITFKANKKHDLVTRVFPRFGKFTCFYFKL